MSIESKEVVWFVELKLRALLEAKDLTNDLSGYFDLAT